MSRSGGVVVVGSANLDVVLGVARFPEAGETVLGQRLEEVPGGKGLNQAIAAAHEGPCAFVGAIGDDEAGRLLLDQLERGGVDTTQLVRRPEPTGRAFIEVTPDGENRIVVMAFANRHVEAGAVGEALSALDPSVVLAQLEIPQEVVVAAAEWASAAGARFVLNASPAAALPSALLARCDPLVVNTVEAAAVLSDGAGNAERDAEARELAGRLAARVASVVVTDGPRGAHVATAGGGVSHVPGHRVAAVDTTGAGDTFAGTLAAALARGMTLDEAAERANAAAARIVQLPRSAR